MQFTTVPLVFALGGLVLLIKLSCAREVIRRKREAFALPIRSVIVVWFCAGVLCRKNTFRSILSQIRVSKTRRDSILLSRRRCGQRRVPLGHISL